MKARLQFSLRTLLVIVTLAAGACAAAGYAYQQHVLAEQRRSVMIRMENVLALLRLDDDANKRLPSRVVRSQSGEPLSSWRFLMVFFIEQQDVENTDTWPKYDQRWDAPANRRFSSQWMPGCFCCHAEAAQAHDTCFFAITGPGTAIDDTTTTSLKKIVDDAATRDTILLVEVRNSKTHWMQPGDFDIRTMPRTINDPAGAGISGSSAGGFCVGFADDEAWMLRNDTPFETLAQFFTIEGARKHDRETVLGPYRIAVNP